MIVRNRGITIQNIVVTEQLNNQIDVNKLGKFEEEGFKYNKEKFPGVFFQDSKDKNITFIIFNSGKIVCTGSKSIKIAKLALNRLVKTLNKLGFKVKQKNEVKITNVIVTSYIKKLPSLSEIVSRLDNVEYDPEVFPGIIYKEKNKDYSAVVLIFRTGKVVCGGIKNVEMAKRAISDLQKKLEKNKGENKNKKTITNIDPQEEFF